MRAVILIGHGGVPADFPRAKVRRLMTLETERVASGAEPGEEELALDRELREHPRTPQTDPYKFGLERLALALRQKLKSTPLYVAYNEFCSPSVPSAVATAIAAGANDIVLVTSMMTPGGSHSEVEIPQLVQQLRKVHPDVRIHYAWPFDLDALASFMVTHIEARGSAQDGARVISAAQAGAAPAQTPTRA